MTQIKRHFVTFFSPGTFVHEETERPIEKWDIDAAKKMANTVIERYGATPFAFQFTTRVRCDGDLDSKQSAESLLYYLGGKVETLADVEVRNDPNEEILRCNMRSNGWRKIVINDNSWRIIQPLRKGDVVLDFKPRKRRKRAA